MAEKLDPNDLVTLEELALSNMWEVGALVRLLQPVPDSWSTALHASDAGGDYGQGLAVERASGVSFETKP